MRRINLTLLAGMLASFAIVAAAIWYEIDGKNPAVFVHPVAVLIVFGGSFTFALVSVPLKDLVRITRRTYYAIRYPKSDFVETVREILRVSIAMSRDVLYLEKAQSSVDNVMLKDGLQLIVMGFKSDEIRRFLEVRRDQNESGLSLCALLYFNLSKLGPALGLVGTLLGLVILLYYNMGGGELDKVGSSMGVALTATLYGVGLANLVFAPLSEYMQHTAEKAQLLDTLIIEGTVLIKERKHPIFMVQALKSYLPREDFAAVEDIVRAEMATIKATAPAEKGAA